MVSWNYSNESVCDRGTTFFIDDRATKENIRWLFYTLGILQLDKVSKDSAVPGLARDDAYAHTIPLPPISEQAAIVEYLDRVTAKIDIAVAGAERQIELLNEYRTRLVADVVTGKLDVRDATPPQS